MRVFVLGRPGVGKTTTLGLLWRNFGIRHFIWDEYWRKCLGKKKRFMTLEWLETQRFSSVRAYIMFHEQIGLAYFEDFLEIVDKDKSDLVFVEANFWAIEHIPIKGQSVILEREEKDLEQHLRRQELFSLSSARMINMFYRKVWDLAPSWSKECQRIRLQTGSYGITELMSHASKISHSW